ncbi:hypothetical protein LSPH24S_07771 [Lysinibacillus sphaericus]
MKEIQFEDVKKNYGQTEVVKGLNLTIEKGERLILLGHFGLWEIYYITFDCRA